MSNTSNYYCEDCGEPRPSGKAIRKYCPRHLKENTTTDTWEERCKLVRHTHDNPYMGYYPEDVVSYEISLAEKRAVERVKEELDEYIEHLRECILSDYEAGRPTPNGYEQKYRGVWYEFMPIDKTPRCDCGLDDVLSKFSNKQ